jgi:hypothetical protein
VKLSEPDPSDTKSNALRAARSNFQKLKRGAASFD